jgi:DNA-binding NarL/FixJ family response regulator
LYVHPWYAPPVDQLSTPITILLVDDHELVRLGASALLATVPHFSLVGQAASVGEALQLARRTRPDVVLLDLRLPDGDGVEACRAIRLAQPETKVLILTSYAEERAVVDCVLAGASGYLLKASGADTLVQAIERVAAGQSVLDPSVTGAALAWMRRVARGAAADDPLGDLTSRERALLRLLGDGCTNREIAQQLHLSEHTVKSYLSDLFKKIGVQRRAEAAAYLAAHESPSA